MSATAGFWGLTDWPTSSLTSQQADLTSSRPSSQPSCGAQGQYMMDATSMEKALQTQAAALYVSGTSGMAFGGGGGGGGGLPPLAGVYPSGQDMMWGQQPSQQQQPSSQSSQSGGDGGGFPPGPRQGSGGASQDSQAAQNPMVWNPLTNWTSSGNI